MSTENATAIPTRRISFEEGLAELPRHFADDDLITSHFVAALSSVFPDGEDFFVRSVRHYRDRIADPGLRTAVKGFIGQESVHGREHRRLNARLAELGYPSQRVERFVRRGLEMRSRIAPPISNLAATAAMEHFTATLAEQAMTDPRAAAMPGHPLVQGVFLWHALEESEHKAVAFDVYRAVGGSERLRIWTMRFTRYGLLTGTLVQLCLSVLGDRRTYRRGELRRSWTRFRGSPVFDRAIWDRLKEYERVGFHPDDRDNAELVAYWRAELFGPSGALAGRLAGAAA